MSEVSESIFQGCLISFGAGPLRKLRDSTLTVFQPAFFRGGGMGTKLYQILEDTDPLSTLLKFLLHFTDVYLFQIYSAQKAKCRPPKAQISQLLTTEKKLENVAPS